MAAVNYDGQLALDIAESVEMEDMLQQHISKAGLYFFYKKNLFIIIKKIFYNLYIIVYIYI